MDDLALSPIRVLLVEDNPGDADLTRETLESNRILLQIEVVTDGIEALAYLLGEGQYAGTPTPDLVLLDLNLPKLSGREVLRTIRQNNSLRHLPVVILSSSEAESDVSQSYRLGANHYVTKPADLAAFQNIIQEIDGLWFMVVKPPR